jgi:hypothetical protein
MAIFQYCSFSAQTIEIVSQRLDYEAYNLKLRGSSSLSHVSAIISYGVSSAPPGFLGLRIGDRAAQCPSDEL